MSKQPATRVTSPERSTPPQQQTSLRPLFARYASTAPKKATP